MSGTLKSSLEVRLPSSSISWKTCPQSKSVAAISHQRELKGPWSTRTHYYWGTIHWAASKLCNRVFSVAPMWPFLCSQHCSPGHGHASHSKPALLPNGACDSGDIGLLGIGLDWRSRTWLAGWMNPDSIPKDLRLCLCRKGMPSV